MICALLCWLIVMAVLNTSKPGWRGPGKQVLRSIERNRWHP